MVPARLRDTVRISRWLVRGWWYAIPRGTWLARIYYSGLATIGTILFGLVITTTGIQVLAPSTRLFLSPDRDAVIGVSATRHGWRIENHAAAHPGHGSARTLRRRVFDAIAWEADAHGTTIYLDVSSPVLERLYAQDLPGLETVRRGIIHRRMVREPGA